MKAALEAWGTKTDLSMTGRAVPQSHTDYRHPHGTKFWPNICLRLTPLVAM
jgi:hypothetical protein